MNLKSFNHLKNDLEDRLQYLKWLTLLIVNAMPKDTNSDIILEVNIF